MENTFKQEQAALSRYIYEEMSKDVVLTELDVLLERYFAQLSHWLWVAYADRAPGSDLLTALIFNTNLGPLVSSTLKAGIDDGAFAWDSASRFEIAFAEFADTFRSTDFIEDIADYRGNFGVDELLERLQSAQ